MNYQFNENLNIMYQFSKKRLENLADKYKINNLYKNYLATPKIETLNDMMRQCTISLQNRQRVTNSIKFDKKETVLKIILHNFDPHNICKEYSSGNEIFQKFELAFGDTFNNSQNTWKKYADYIYSAAIFLHQFDDLNAFKDFIESFSANTYTKIALPLLLAEEIEGFGFALACDCLKESGLIDCPKPDVHIIEIIKKTGKHILNNFDEVTKQKKEQYYAYRIVIEMANGIGCTAYELDKIFWLICTENFDRKEDQSLQKQPGNKKRADKNREDFIEEFINSIQQIK